MIIKMIIGQGLISSFPFQYGKRESEREGKKPREEKGKVKGIIMNH